MKPHKFLYKQSYHPDATKDGCFDDAKKKKNPTNKNTHPKPEKQRTKINKTFLRIEYYKTNVNSNYTINIM